MKLDDSDEELRRCSRCSEMRSIKQFRIGRKGEKNEYRYAFCDTCRREQINQHLNSHLESFLSDRYRKLVVRCKLEEVPCTISKQEYIDQYHKQDGICFYTFRKMLCQVGNGNQPNALSIDRIDPLKGYEAGNFVFCTTLANTIKNNLTLPQVRAWLPFWYERIVGTEKHRFNVIFEIPPQEEANILHKELQTFSDNRVGRIFVVAKENINLCHNPDALPYYTILKTSRSMSHLELDCILSDFNKHKGRQYYVGFNMCEPKDF